MLTIQPVPAPRPPPRKSIPLHSADLEVIVAANDTAPTEPILRALSAQQATVIVDRTEEEVRARVEAEIIAIVRKALGTMMPPPRTDHGASVRWLVVGLVTGAIVVYVLMAGALYDKEVALAMSRVGGPAPIFTTSPVTHTAPQPTTTCSTVSEGRSASSIPSYDVESLPRHANSRRIATPKPVASTNVDEENPYADVEIVSPE